MNRWCRFMKLMKIYLIKEDNIIEMNIILKKLLFLTLYCYIVGLGLNYKFIDLLFKRSVIEFIKISSHLDFIVSEIIYNQTDTLTQILMDLR